MLFVIPSISEQTTLKMNLSESQLQTQFDLTNNTVLFLFLLNTLSSQLHRRLEKVSKAFVVAYFFACSLLKNHQPQHIF